MLVARVLVCGVLSCCGGLSGQALAQSKLAEINQKTITVLSGESQWFDETLAITQKMSHVDGLRLIAMHGDGCIDSAADVLQLTQVDVALLSTDCVDYAEAQGLLPSAANKFSFIARIRAAPLLLLTTRNFNNVTALAGKRIATGAANSAGFASGELVLGGLDLPFTRVARSGAEAIELLKRGETDAVLLHGLDELTDGLDAKQLHVLGLTAPQALSKQYAPALVDAGALGGSVETVSTSLLLAVYNWPKNSAKAQKIKQFTKIYFEQHAAGDEAQELSASVPGWNRHAISLQALETLTLNTPDIQQGDGP